MASEIGEPAHQATPQHAHTSPSGGKSAAQQRADYLLGIALLLVVVLLWTGSNFLTNSVLTSGYDKPFAVTFANTSSFALYLAPFLCARKRKSPSRSAQDVSHQGWWPRLGFALPAQWSCSDEELARGKYAAIPSAAHGRASDELSRPGEQATSIGGTLPRHRPTRQASPANSRTHLNGSAQQSYEVTRSAGLPEPPAPENPMSGTDRLRRPSLLEPRPSSIDGRRPRTIVYTDSVQPWPALPAGRLPPLTVRETARLAAQFTFVWFAANWSLNAGLGLTSVASGTTLSSASGFFTLALGSFFGVERFSTAKLGAVTMSFLGVVMVTWADSSSSDVPPPSTSTAAPINAPLGDALALLSAFCYAVYVTLLKVRIGEEERVSMPLFFGFVGAFNIAAMWPFGLVLHFTGIEPFAWPSNGMTWAGVGVNMAITFVSDMCYLIAMLKSSPLVATIGLSLTIPLAVAGDIARGSHSGGVQADLGALLVLLSFVAVGVTDNLMLADATPDPTVHASGPTNYDGRDSLDESEMETEPSGGRHSAELSSDDEPLAERTSRRGRLMHREQRRDLDNGFDR